jgi:hypothetical protein
MSRFPSIVRTAVITTVLLLVSVFVGSTPAFAGSFTNNYDGQDSYIGSGSTTLNYSNGHAAFNETIWTDAGTNGGSRLNWPYTIRMYNGSGTQVWSALNQTSRTYYTGSNVTKIVIVPNSGYVGVAVNWRKA